MKIELEVLGLETTGDGVRVKAQGKPKRSADWRTWDTWTFTVPTHVARHYSIGQFIKVEVKP